jgi:hypothetical protein
MSDRGEASTPERDAELLTAYVDGAGELSPDERRRIEAMIEREPAARADEAALRTLLGSLRALPPEGVEPDWSAMAESVRDAVGQDVPRPWWRRWRWAVPLTACAAATALLVVLWASPSPSPVVSEAPPVPVRDVPDVPDVRSVELREDSVALWLDGAPVDVELSAADLLGAPELPEIAGGSPGEAPGDATGIAALLPASDLAWLDDLDDDALAQVERWLDEPEDPAPAGAGEARPGRTRHIGRGQEGG